MNLRQLEAFRAVMTAGTATKAAGMLNISQPAISRLVAQFERDLGFLLFEREKGRLLPTPEAASLFDEVEKTFHGIDKLMRTARTMRTLGTGHLRVAGLPSLSYNLLPKAVAHFIQACPGATVTLDVRNSDGVIDWVSSQQFDLGIVVLPLDSPGVLVEPLTSVEAVCVMPRGHSLQALPTIRPEDLRGHPMISLSRRHMSRLGIEQLLGGAEVSRLGHVEASTAGSACTLVAEGLGVAIVNPFTAAGFRDRLEVRPFHPTVTYDFALLFPLHRPRSRLAAAFVDSLKNVLADFTSGAWGQPVPV